MLILRGLCPASKLDHQYTPWQLKTDPNTVVLLGRGSSRIDHDDVNDKWVITDDRANARGTSGASQHSYALGKHTWTFTTSQQLCGSDDQLKLTGCDQEGEFTCDDGQCVRMEQRCDQLPNCRDESDERGCQLLVLKDNYNNKVPPISTNYKFEVHVSITLMKVVAITVTEHKIDFSFTITLKWSDNRVTYHNLKNDPAQNKLSSEDVSSLWLPYVIYVNTDNKETTSLQGREWEPKTDLMVERKGDLIRSGLEVVDETEIFFLFINYMLM